MTVFIWIVRTTSFLITWFTDYFISTSSAASTCILVPLEQYRRPKNGPKEFLVTLFPYIFHVKAKLNIVYKYLKRKIFARDINVVPQMHWTSNVFATWPTTTGGFWVSLNYPIHNFKKTVCPKNVWVWYWQKSRSINEVYIIAK